MAHHAEWTFGFDGWTAREAETLVARLLWIAVTTVQSLGLIVDPGLPETLSEWEAFLADRGKPLPASAGLVWLADHSFREPGLWVSPQPWSEWEGDMP